MLSKSFETLLVRKVSFAEECQLTEILYCTFGWALASPGKCQHFSKLLQKRAGSVKVLTKKHGTNLPVLLIFAKFGALPTSPQQTQLASFFSVSRNLSRKIAFPHSGHPVLNIFRVRTQMES